MLASIGLITIVCAVAFIRMARTGGLRRRRVLASIVVGAIAVVGAGVVMGPGLARRFDAARADLNRAIEHKDFYTDTGGRLLMGWKGIEATGEHPLIGVGIGGYKAWCHADLDGQGIDPATRNIHSHAHNAYIHIASSFGVPALLVALAALTAATVGGLSVGVRSDAGSDANARRWVDFGSYDAGPAVRDRGADAGGHVRPHHHQHADVRCALCADGTVRHAPVRRTRKTPRTLTNRGERHRRWGWEAGGTRGAKPRHSCSVSHAATR
jgi:hypothetical protein